MRNESSDDLLVIITMQNDEPEAARQAFYEFHHRFKDYVWSVCYTLSRGISDPNRIILAKDIFNDTFLDVYQNYKSKGYFDPDRCQDIEKGIKVWLAGIANNHLKRAIEAVKMSSRISYLDACPDRPFFEFNEDAEIPDAPRMVLLKRVLETVLNEKQREILLLSIQFEEQGKLPGDIKRALCEAYGVKPDSLRQIKKRAIDKVEKFLRLHGHLSPSKIKLNVK